VSVKNKSAIMEAAIENIYLNIPKTDMHFFTELAKKMGWSIDTKKRFVEKVHRHSSQKCRII
jgi:hypothetical protein